MRIAIDVREACKTVRTGKAQWAFGFTSALLARDDVSLQLFSDGALPSSWIDILRNSRHTHRLVPGSGLAWHRSVARVLRSQGDGDIYLSPTSYIVPFFLGKRFKHIPVVHDLIAFRNEPHDRKATIIERLTLKRVARTAHMICTVSETTKRDLLERFPELDERNIIPLFAGPMSTSLAASNDPTIILCIATLSPRKNQRRLIEAYARLPDDVRNAHRLVLVGGRGWNDEDIIRAAQQTPGVEWKKYLSQQECDALLRDAIILAFPSVYEGFGMPILDAFGIGVPVLTSNVGSMKEVAGDAAMLVDPSSVDSIANGLADLLADAALRTELIRKGKERYGDFSWKRSTEIFVQALNARANLP